MKKDFAKNILNKITKFKLLYFARYFILLLLMFVLLVKILSGAIWGDAPRPQIPPDGYFAQENKITLHWTRGDYEGSFRLQVVAGGDDFKKASEENSFIVDKKMSLTTYSLSSLELGEKYCWRIIDEDDGIIFCFKTSQSMLAY